MEYSNAYKLWNALTNKNKIFTYGNTKIESTVKNLKDFCISVDYSFDNIRTMVIIKRLINAKQPICNYFSTEMIYLLSIKEPHLLTIKELESIKDVILSENKEFVLPNRFSSYDSLISFEEKLKIVYSQENNKCVIVPPKDLIWLNLNEEEVK